MEALEDPAIEPEVKPKRPTKRSKGRPKKGEIDTAAAQLERPFPAPPKSIVKDGIIPPEKFWKYRRDLPEEFLPRLSFYIYREWPKTDVCRNWTKEMHAQVRAHTRKMPIKYTAQYADLDPEGWWNQLINAHGSGQYLIRLNDCGVAGNKDIKKGTVCKTVVDCFDDDFLPVIEDLSIVCFEDPANARYVNDLRMKGVSIPGDKPAEETDDMAANAAVEKLADALVEQSKTKTPATAPDNTMANMFSDLLRQSEARAIKQEELREARHQREMEILTKRLEAAESAVKERHGTVDPMEMTRSVVEMARTVASSSGTSQPDPMREILLEMVRSGETRHLKELELSETRHAREMETMNKRLDAEAAARAAAETARQQQIAQPAGKSAIHDAIALVKALKGATEEINGDTSAGSGNVWVDLASEHLPRVLDTISNVATAIKTPAVGTSALQAPNGQQAAAPQNPPQEQSEVNQAAMYARAIEPHLIEALQNGVPGETFAGFFIVNYQEQTYQMLVQQGEAGIMNLLQSAPDVWGKVQRYAARVPEFLRGFLNVEAAMEAAQRIRAGQTRPMQPPPAGRPANQPRPVTIENEPSAPGGGRTVIRGDGQTVKTRPNGPVVPGETA